MRTLPWIVGVLGLLGLGVFELSGLRARFLGRQRLRFAYATQTKTEKAALPGWQRGEAELADGAKVWTSRMVPPGGVRGWVFYLPGNDEAQIQTAELWLSRALGGLPLGGFVASYRGFEGQVGTPEVGAIRADELAFAERLLAEEHLRPEQLHLVGFSIGGYMAGSVAAALATSGRPPGSLTLLAPGYDLVMLRPSRWQRYAPGDDYQMAPFLAQIQSPTLVLQGADDDAFYGPGQGQAVHRSVQGSSYQEFPGEKHVGLLSSDAARQAFRRWISERPSVR